RRHGPGLLNIGPSTAVFAVGNPGFGDATRRRRPLARSPNLFQPAAADGAALLGGVAAPDAFGLIGLDGIGETIAGDGTDGTDFLGGRDGGQIGRIGEELDPGGVGAGGGLSPVFYGDFGFGGHGGSH